MYRRLAVTIAVRPPQTPLFPHKAAVSVSLVAGWGVAKKPIIGVSRHTTVSKVATSGEQHDHPWPRASGLSVLESDVWLTLTGSITPSKLSVVFLVSSPTFPIFSPFFPTSFPIFLLAFFAACYCAFLPWSRS